MKIIIEAETKEEKDILEGKKVEFTDVRRYFLFGLRLEKGIAPQDFQHWSGTLGWIVGQLHVWLKNFEQKLLHANEKEQE